MVLNYSLWVLILWFVLPFLATIQANREKRKMEDELDRIVKKVNNNKKSTWKAVKNEYTVELFNIYESLPPMTGFDESPSRNVVPDKNMSYDVLPPTFDARKRWPFCEGVINRVRRQGRCGSCWAVNAAAVMTDRICIASNGTKKFYVSAEDLISCCLECQSNKSNVCGGGFGYKAFSYWTKSGVVSGGETNSSEGCKPYSQKVYNSVTSLSCEKKCTNRNYRKTYENDKVFAKYYYRFQAGAVTTIMDEIQNNGSALGLMVVYTDLFGYKTGVYESNMEQKKTNHFIRIIGWGTENGTKYWLCINSWGTNWGENGFFKIRRGDNHCNIEKEVSAGTPLNVSKARLNKPLHKMILCTFGVIFLMRKQLCAVRP